MAKPNIPKIEKAPSAGGSKKKIIIPIVIAVVVAVILIYIFIINPKVLAWLSEQLTTGAAVAGKETFVEMPKTNITENPDLLPPTDEELGGDVI